MLSTLVAALRSPPTASISSAIWRAVRRRVPLNAMCSRKCEMPCSSCRSSRLPELTQTPSEAVSRCGIVSVTTWMPDFKVGHRYAHAAAPSCAARLVARTKRSTAD